MSGRRVVPGAFGAQVREQVRGVPVTHPVVGVRPRDAVLGVLMRTPRRPRGSRHSGHRTATRLVAAPALLAAALMSPLAFSQPASGADKKTTFTVALTSDLDSFNPFLGVEANSYEMWALTYDYLVDYSMKDMSPAPGLAKTWETSDDGKTWTFHMRSGVAWSDGQDLTAG